MKHDTRPLERLRGELLPLSHQLAEASQFVAELQASGQIRDTRQGDDPEQLELDAACAVKAIGQAHGLVIHQARALLIEYLNSLEKEGEKSFVYF